VAYGLSLRNVEEIMAERRRSIDHSTVHRWVINLLPVQEKGFRRRKSPIGKPVSGESGGRSTDYESTSSSNRSPVVGGETTAVLQWTKPLAR
jgi:hypothetical protein